MRCTDPDVQSSPEEPSPTGRKEYNACALKPAADGQRADRARLGYNSP
jgi:hypothetical protein